MGGTDFIKDVDAGVLPPVTFYKPQGNLNEHPGYTDVESGDRHLTDVIEHLRRGPQWAHMIVIVTYDENGGFWDHVAPPKADRWGPEHASLRSSRHPSQRKHMSITRNTTQRRSCISSRIALACRHCQV
jgi:acid phosphatase